MKKTLQDQYLLIKEGKGHKGVFLTEAKRQFPNIVRNAATFEEATASLITKNIITENVIGLTAVNSPFEPKKKESYELAYEEGTELLKQYATTRGGMIQCWYYAEAFEILDTNKQDENFYDDFLNNVFDIVGHIYDIDSSTLTRHASQATYYPKGSFLTEHSDGKGTGRVCAVLIYLNESYEEKDGGYLVLDKKEKVLPHFGNVAIIDLQSFDVKHEVTEVVGGIGRYAFLTFIKTKENELVNF
jgi:Rps23 Pro-64 3,4-dihydroxylase Tpa1-like proline 4-hydroxylase